MTVIFDTPTWGTVGAWNITEMFTLGAMSPWHNNCCGEFPWQYQQPSSGLVIGFAVISLSWHDKMGAWAICHGRCVIMMPRNIAPSVKEPVDFFITHFQASVMPRYCAAIVMGSNLGWVNRGKAGRRMGEAAAEECDGRNNWRCALQSTNPGAAENTLTFEDGTVYHLSCTVYL